jgi:hypothetical protein
MAPKWIADDDGVRGLIGGRGGLPNGRVSGVDPIVALRAE